MSTKNRRVNAAYLSFRTSVIIPTLRQNLLWRETFCLMEESGRVFLESRTTWTTDWMGAATVIIKRWGMPESVMITDLTQISNNSKNLLPRSNVMTTNVKNDEDRCYVDGQSQIHRDEWPKRWPIWCSMIIEIVWRRLLERTTSVRSYLDRVNQKGPIRADVMKSKIDGRMTWWTWRANDSEIFRVTYAIALRCTVSWHGYDLKFFVKVQSSTDDHFVNKCLSDSIIETCHDVVGFIMHDDTKDPEILINDKGSQRAKKKDHPIQSQV